MTTPLAEEPVDSAPPTIPAPPRARFSSRHSNAIPIVPPRARLSRFPSIVGFVGAAVALMLVFHAGRIVPTASAHGIEPPSSATTSSPPPEKTTCVEPASPPPATPEAKPVAASVTPPVTRNVKRTKVSHDPPVTTAPAAKGNAKDARLDQAARTAAMLRAQLDGNP